MRSVAIWLMAKVCWFPGVSLVASTPFYILPWTIMVVEESCSLVDFYAGIRDGTVEVLFVSTSPFVFPEAFRE